MTGLITEIQRFSLHDGPGIRTTIFLKGCNMKCSWCHNPETIKNIKQIHYYEQNCIQCFKCVTVCPSKAHKKIAGEHRYFPNLCIRCGKCADICYPEGMVVSGIAKTVREVMEEILQDKPYYVDSGGGVTISGGEVLCQIPFSLELAEACHSEGIHVVVQTNLSKPFEEIKPLLGKTDLILCDLKLMDNEEHIKWTGLGNTQIIDNLLKLDTMGIPYIVRTPLIPGVSDTKENIEAIAGFLARLKGVLYYELINFNPLGGYKYKSLGIKDLFSGVKPLSSRKIEELKEYADKFVQVVCGG